MHTNLELSKEHRANLHKLAEYLYNLKPTEQNRFDMWSFATRYKDKNRFYVRMFEFRDVVRDCQTAACAVGHAAMIFDHEPEESWNTFATRLFGVDNCHDDGHVQTDTFSFLFGSDWSSRDNTPKGAAQRIIFALREGVPNMTELCENWRKWENCYTHLTLDDLPEED